MIRSRDFFLFVTIVLFLLVGIGTTLFSKEDAPLTDSSLRFTDGVDREGVSIDTAGKPNREERLNSMRSKIADGATLYIQDNFYEADELDEPGQIISAEESVLLCQNYQPFSGNWNASLVTMEIDNNSRTLYRSIVVSSGVSASTTTTSIEREPVAVLSLFPQLLASPACIASDVIGFTLGGDLIRNNDTLTYLNYTDSLLIGYALDGNPIYGQTSTPTDNCGGAAVGGTYRYYLSANRDTILNCFVALPANI